MSISVSTRQAYTEIDKLLSIMPEEYIKKVPLKLREKFKNEKDIFYSFEIDNTKHLNEQGLSSKSLALLAMLKYNYWCNSEEEKNQLKIMFIENEYKYQKQQREKYNLDNLFKKSKKELENKHVEMMVYKKESFFNKIKNIIYRILRK